MNTAMKPIAKLFSIPGRQAGMALITGLIFMVVLTLIAVAAMRTATLEERMSGNARDRDLAFQAAEAALRAGEQVLQGPGVLPPFAPGTAYTPRIPDGSISGYWKTTHPWTTQSVAAWQPAGTSAAPRYVIEEMDMDMDCPGSGRGIANLDENEGVYRVTARGVGSSANAVVILQAFYQFCDDY